MSSSQFKVGEIYKLKYPSHYVSDATDWDYLVEVKKVEQKRVHLFFMNLDGSPAGYPVEVHNLSHFGENGGTKVQKLTKLERALR